ncbi:cysteine proteinase [Gonapodya prolifera JEL478]|uniref:Ubiquitin carboxyl-terminal hydrolase n=1 Tax=Gonapodya prolifera (strain JEL478) TaxID=1344416 RepID=A0A139A8A3_GONPJ|nr:cysteine proteinase [Gonapodya prolifera JEL478]|eukprot:KXS12934.1 cysteine proteinase [Gonapodya prolifera JEL478]
MEADVSIGSSAALGSVLRHSIPGITTHGLHPGNPPHTHSQPMHIPNRSADKSHAISQTAPPALAGCSHLEQLKRSNRWQEFSRTLEDTALEIECGEKQQQIQSGGKSGDMTEKRGVGAGGAKKARVPALCPACHASLRRPVRCVECSFLGCLKCSAQHYESSGHSYGLHPTTIALFCHPCGDFRADLDVELVCDRARVRGKAMRVAVPKIASWATSSNPAGPAGLTSAMNVDESDRITQQQFRSVSEPPRGNEGLTLRQMGGGSRCASGLRGLRNIGSTCFMNVVLQTFVHNPLLRAYFLSGAHTQERCRAARRGEVCLACEMDRLFAEFYSPYSDSGPFAPVHFLRTLWLSAQGLAGYQQQDAHEFLIAALDGVHSGCCESSPPSDATKCRCVVHQTFAGLLQSDVTCLRCGSVTTKVDSFMDISLHISRPTHSPTPSAAIRRPGQVGRPPKVMHSAPASVPPSGEETATLADCFERFTQPERLHAAYDCKRCGSKQEVTKRITVKRAPQVLCVQLKRFEHNSLIGTKIDSFVKLPVELDLRDYTTAAVKAREAKTSKTDLKSKMRTESGENEPEMEPEMEPPYVLYAVIEHFGNINSGHYRCYVKSRGQWFVFDDHAVSLVDEKYVLSVKAYLCFFTKFPLEFRYISESPTSSPLLGPSLILDLPHSFTRKRGSGRSYTDGGSSDTSQTDSGRLTPPNNGTATPRVLKIHLKPLSKDLKEGTPVGATIPAGQTLLGNDITTIPSPLPGFTPSALP